MLLLTLLLTSGRKPKRPQIATISIELPCSEIGINMNSRYALTQLNTTQGLTLDRALPVVLER